MKPAVFMRCSVISEFLLIRVMKVTVDFHVRFFWLNIVVVSYGGHGMCEPHWRISATSWCSFVSFKLHLAHRHNKDLTFQLWELITAQHKMERKQHMAVIKQLIKYDLFASATEKDITASNFSLAWNTYCNFLKIYHLCLASDRVSLAR